MGAQPLSHRADSNCTCACHVHVMWQVALELDSFIPPRVPHYSLYAPYLLLELANEFEGSLHLDGIGLG